MSFEVAERVADAILWEGYVLYPYRASADKNRCRWQFGVLVPRGYAERAGESWTSRTECLMEAGPDTTLDLRVRFLHVQSRSVELAAGGGTFQPVDRAEIDGRELVSWDEGLERRFDRTGLALAGLLGPEQVFTVEAAGGTEVDPVADATGSVRARVIRDRRPLAAAVRVAAEPAGGVVRLRVVVENRAPWPADAPPVRDAALRQSLIGVHTLLRVHGGSFVSLLDPPDWAAPASAGCSNQHTWPVLVGEPGARDVMLSSPILLYDYPAVAPESPGDLFDATEIDEILTLRIMTLTEDEKREARATDERARRVIDRSDALPPEVFERLHGAIRHLA